MSKFLKKLTEAQVKGEKKSLSNNHIGNSKKQSSGKFAGMAAKAVRLEPVIIPGYKILG